MEFEPPRPGPDRIEPIGWPAAFIIAVFIVCTTAVVMTLVLR